MLRPDRADAPHHRVMSSWLADAVSDLEPVGLTDAVLSGYVRIVTHPRVVDLPTPTDEAIGHVRSLLDDEGTVRVVPGSLFPREFERLCLAVDARGNLVSDAAHAALAVEAGATWYSRDRDFARFPGLRSRVPGE
ncbi:MAG: TA system VapC family ribonuclease toxin [Dermatophilaceae bacterium]